MAGISQHCKTGDVVAFGESVGVASKALCGLTEAAGQVSSCRNLLPPSTLNQVLLRGLEEGSTLTPPVLLLLVSTEEELLLSRRPRLPWEPCLYSGQCGRTTGTDCFLLLSSCRPPTWWACPTPTVSRATRAWWIPSSLQEPTRPYRWPARTWWTLLVAPPR